MCSKGECTYEENVVLFVDIDISLDDRVFASQ